MSQPQERHGLHRPDRCCIACYRWHERLTATQALRLSGGRGRVGTYAGPGMNFADYEKERRRKAARMWATREGSG